MLRITVSAAEFWDEEKQEFVYTKEYTLQLEHSLVSLSKWESKHRKPFLSKKPKSAAELIDYIKCMTITQNVPPEVYGALTRADIAKITAYIDEPMTATTFSGVQDKQSSVPQTAELIYFSMIDCGIPFECQKWHLNRLLTLIRVCSIKRRKPRKMSESEIMRRNAAINAKRRHKFKSKG